MIEGNCVHRKLQYHFTMIMMKKVSLKAPTTKHHTVIICKAGPDTMCRTCVHYSQADDTCKALSAVHHLSQAIHPIKASICRSQNDLCGKSPKYFEKIVVPMTPISSHLSCCEDDVVVAYFVDGSSGLTCKDAGAEKYYHGLQYDFNDVY